jgi:hypothetical protein
MSQTIGYTVTTAEAFAHVLELLPEDVNVEIIDGLGSVVTIDNFRRLERGLLMLSATNGNTYTMPGDTPVKVASPVKVAASA